MDLSLQKNRIPALLLGCILLIGLLLRFWAFSTKIHDFYLTGDAKNYYLMSHQIIDDHIYGYALDKKSGISNAYVTPGYPIFLAAVYAITNDKYLQITAVKLLQVIIGGLATPLLAFLAIRLIFKRADIALLSTLFIAIYPTYIISVNYLLTEVSSLAAMLLYFYLIAAAMQERKNYLFALSGAAFAVNILIRPTMLPLYIIPFIVAHFTAYKRDRLLLLKFFTISIAGFVVVMLPWWMRNYLTMHRIIILATGSQDPLLAGTYPYMQGLFKDYLSENVRVSEAEYAKKRIIEGFTTQPLLYLKWYTVGKLQYLFTEAWLRTAPPFNSALGIKLTDVMQSLLIYAGSAGAIINSAIKRLNLYIGIYGLVFLGLLLIFIPVNRYAYHHMFFLMLSTSALLCYIKDFVSLLIVKLRSAL